MLLVAGTASRARTSHTHCAAGHSCRIDLAADRHAAVHAGSHLHEVGRSFRRIDFGRRLAGCSLVCHRMRELEAEHSRLVERGIVGRIGFAGRSLAGGNHLGRIRNQTCLCTASCRTLKKYTELEKM